MRQTEQKLWDRMRGAFSDEGIFARRIENLVGVGDPDLYTISFGFVTFIELKGIKQEDVPARTTTPLLGARKGLNPDQRNWHHTCARRGGRSLIVIGVGHDIITIPGIHADVINDATLGELQSCSIADNFRGLCDLVSSPMDKWPK